MKPVKQHLQIIQSVCVIFSYSKVSGIYDIKKTDGKPIK